MDASVFHMFENVHNNKQNRESTYNPSKDSELAQVGRILRRGHKHLSLVFDRDALCRLKANDKGY